MEIELDQDRETDSYGEDERRYWAREKPDDLHRRLVQRTERHHRSLRNSPTIDLIARNWAYYYGQWSPSGSWGNSWGGAIRRMGDHGELSFLGANNFRNLLHHLYVLTIRDRPAPQAKATSTDPDSLRSAEMVENLVEQFLRRDRLEKRLNLAVEEAIVLTEGYVAADWDHMSGKIIPPEGVGLGGEFSEGMGFSYTGDLGVWNPSLLDVIHNPRRWPWQDNDWVLVRRKRNRWDLAAAYPERADEIIDTQEDDDQEIDIFGTMDEDEDDEDDIISEWIFYHKLTPAVPLGRKMCFVKGAWLSNDVLPEYLNGMIPVFRCAPAEILLSSYGYSPGFDLQGPQEAANMIMSSLVTNFDSFGVQNLWTPPGNPVSSARVSGGLRLLQSNIKPEPLQLTQNPADAYKFFETVIQQMELISGINSVMRGQPEASLKSGKALSLIEMKAVQYASALIQSNNHLFEDFATCLVRILSAKLKEGHPLVVQVAGRMNSANFRRQVTSEDLARVDRIVIESANPLSKTLAGRMEWAEHFLKEGFIKSPEQLMTVFTTGRLEPLYESERATIGLISSENDALMRGEIAPVLKSDNQALHLREQLAQLSTPAVRSDERIAANVLGHCAVHIAMLYLPDVIDLQLAQGFSVPQLTTTLPPGILESVGPEYMGSFSPEDMGMLAAASNPGEFQNSKGQPPPENPEKNQNPTAEPALQGAM